MKREAPRLTLGALVVTAALLVAALPPLPARADTVTVTGTVEVGGTQLSGDGYVLFIPASECDSPSNWASAGQIADITAGTFTIDRPAGDYRVKIVPHHGTGAAISWADSATSCAGSRVLSLATNQTLPPLEALAGHTVAGEVRSDNGLVPEGKVALYRTCDDFREHQEAGTASIDPFNARFEMTLPTGTYRARVIPASATAPRPPGRTGLRRAPLRPWSTSPVRRPATCSHALGPCCRAGSPMPPAPSWRGSWSSTNPVRMLTATGSDTGRWPPSMYVPAPTR